MTPLSEVLALYAEENLVCRILREHAPQIRAANARTDQLTRKLTALSPEAAGWMEQLRNELDTAHSCREQAFLLSGISIGLELGRL